MPDCRPSPRSTFFHMAFLLSAAMLLGSVGCVELPPLKLTTEKAPSPAYIPSSDQHGLRSFGSPGRAAAPAIEQVLVVITYGNGCSADGPGNGLRDLADILRQAFSSSLVQVITRTFDQQDDLIEQKVQNHRGPVMLIGHSYGGWRSFEIASRVSRAIDFLILLDPVPHNDWMIRHPGKYFRLPASVRNGICYYRPDGGWPTSYPIVNPKNWTDNRPRDLSHNEFCQNSEIRRYILAACAAASPSRSAGSTAVAVK